MIQSPGAAAVHQGSVESCVRTVRLQNTFTVWREIIDKMQTVDNIDIDAITSGCPKGLYGKFCNKKCNCANNGRCHRTYGACLCDPGLYGRFCHLRESYTLTL